MKFRTLCCFIFCVVYAFQSQAMTTKGNQIINSNGEVVELKGINWFGFNNGDTMVDGLWAGPDGLSLDFATVVYRMQLLGFNAVRLPFSFKDLNGLSPKVYSQTAAQATQSEIQASVTDPSVSVPAGSTIPAQNSPPTIVNAGVSNSYLPNDTTLNRFLFVVNFFAKNGFYVLIDNHLREDQTVLQSGTAAWVKNWVNLVTAISKDPVSKKMLMIDILNEPDNYGVRWEASGSLPGLRTLYLAMMDAVYPVNPDALFFIEGAGQGGIGCNWGDGFCTDAALISANGLSDPTLFFSALMHKPYLNQVVISPHVYPPSVTGASTGASGTSLWTRLSESFGYLTQGGFCPAGSTTCKVFPVALGEFGSTFTDARDLQTMPDLASYLNNTGSAADGQHKAIKNWFYWDWNANSGDTGGIVADDWRTINWVKVRYLTGVGLNPWYFKPTPAEYGKLCLEINSQAGLTTSSLKPINVGNYTFSINSFNTPVCQSVAVGNYTVSAPEIVIGNKKFVAPSQAVSVTKGQTATVDIKYTETIIPATPVLVTVQMGTPWQSSPGGPYYNVINLFFSNSGTTSVNAPWQMTLQNSAYASVSSSWNLTVNSVKNGLISTTIPNSWETLGPHQSSVVNVGLIVSSSSQ
ncbi:MAG TPA: cellulase family glycosylhydrolase, partial [Chlamydiales bacterium]|nr:cellulase family glycosylhydrolase [Chlamydiales bacterium]